MVKNGEFAYNKSYSNGYPWGAIKRLDLYEMGVLSTLYIVFKPTNVNSDFLSTYYETTNGYKEVAQYAAEGARNHGLLNISADDFFKTEITIPTTEEEQQKLGTFFRQLDRHITIHQRKLESVKKLKAGLLQKMFPKNGEVFPEIRFPEFTYAWEQKTLGKMAKTYSGGTPSVSNSKFYGGDIPFIRSGEIGSDTTELFITEEGLNNSSAKLVSKGDILYALYGATSGEVSRSLINGAINQAILSIQPKDDYDVEFIAQWLKNQKTKITSSYLQGGQGNLSAEIVKNLQISIPPQKKEQQKIGQFFQKIDRLIKVQQRELDNLKNLKKALLQQMFV